MAGSELRACPFCRQYFEGGETCPEHGLRLLPVHRLPKAREAVAEDAPLAGHDLRFGRGVVLLGAGLMAVGFLLPMFAHPLGALAPKSGLAFAAERAAVLWIIPSAAALMGSVVLRRTTRRALRGARLVVPALALLAAAAELYVLDRVQTAAGALLARGAPVAVEPAYGVAVVLVGVAVAAIGGAWLGGARPLEAPPRSAQPRSGG